MNKNGNNKDPLSSFINHEMIEKAPDGFTSKVMSVIQVEPRLSNSHAKREKSLVPWVFAGVLLVLMIATFLLPEGNNLLTSSLNNIIKRFEIALPAFDFPKIDFIALPGWVPYIIAGILILSVFDRALYSFFHRRGN